VLKKYNTVTKVPRGENRKKLREQRTTVNKNNSRQVRTEQTEDREQQWGAANVFEQRSGKRKKDRK
jgi:hypothetical protein